MLRGKRFLATLLCLVMVLSVGMTAKAANDESTATLETKYPGEDVYSASWIFGHYGAFMLDGDVECSHLVGPVATKGVVKTSGGFANYTLGVSSYIYGDGLSAEGDIDNVRDNFQCPPLYVGPNYKVEREGEKYFLTTTKGRLTAPEGTAIYKSDNFIDWMKAETELKAESTAMLDSAKTDVSVVHITVDDIIVEHSMNYKGYEIEIGTTVVVEQEAFDKMLKENMCFYLKGNFESKTPTVINIENLGAWTMPNTLVYDKEQVVRTSDELGKLYGYPQDNLKYLTDIGADSINDTVDFNRAGTNVVWNVPNATEIKYKNETSKFGHLLAPNADVTGSPGNSEGGFICKSANLGGAEVHMFAMGSDYSYGDSSGGTPKPTPIETSVTFDKLLYKDKIGGDILTQKAGEFEFTLTGIKGTETEGEVYTAKNDATGVANFNVEHNEKGEYRYILTEKNLGASDITYDKTVYNVLISVSENGGKLEAVVSYTDEAGNAVADDKVAFTNVRATVDDPGKLPGDGDSEDGSGSGSGTDGSTGTGGSGNGTGTNGGNGTSGGNSVTTDKSAQTGDASNIFMMFVLMYVAAGSAIALYGIRRSMKEDK